MPRTEWWAQMKLVIVTPEYPNIRNVVSGLFIEEQVRGLLSAGHDVAVIHFRRCTRMELVTRMPFAVVCEETAEGAALLECAYPWPSWGWARPLERRAARLAVLAAANKLQDLNERVIFAQWLMPGAEACAPLARKHDLPFCAIARGSDLHSAVSASRRRRLGCTLNEVPTLLGNGEWARNQLSEMGFGQHAARLKVARNIRRLPEPRVRECTHPTDGKLVAISALEEKKGLDVLLQALAMLTTPWSLEVIGDGSRRRELEAQRARLALKDRVAFRGRLPHSEALDALRSADLFVLPSRREGVPNALIEAMAIGVPAVATEVGGVTELLRDRVTGRLVPPDNPHALAAAIDECLRHPNRARQWAEAGMALVRAMYDPEVNVATLCDHLAYASRVKSRCKRHW